MREGLQQGSMWQDAGIGSRNLAFRISGSRWKNAGIPQQKLRLRKSCMYFCP